MEVKLTTARYLLGVFLLILNVHSMQNLGLRIRLVNNFDIEFSPSQLQSFYNCLCSSQYSSCKVVYKVMSQGYMMVYRSGPLEDPSSETNFVCDQPEGNGTEFTCSRKTALKEKCDINESCKFSLLKVIPGIDCPSKCIVLGWSHYEVKYEHFDVKQKINANCDAVTNVTLSPDVSDHTTWTSSEPQYSTIESMRTSTLAATDKTSNVQTIGVIVACVLLAILICLFVLAAICWRKRRVFREKTMHLSELETHPLSGEENKSQRPAFAQVTHGEEDDDEYTAYVTTGHAYCTIPDNASSQSEIPISEKNHPMDATGSAYSEPSTNSLQPQPVGNITSKNEENSQAANFYSRVEIGRNEAPANVSESVLKTYDGAPGISHRSFIKKELSKECRSPDTTGNTTDAIIGESPQVYSRLDNGRNGVPEETSRSFLETYDGPVLSRN